MAIININPLFLVVLFVILLPIGYSIDKTAYQRGFRDGQMDVLKRRGRGD